MFTSAVDVVNVTVTVRDKAGRPVKDLRAQDFTLLEDGRPQAVQVFGRSFDPGDDELLSLDLGMLMDTSTSMLEELKLSQEAAARFLESVPRARELITVFFDDQIHISRYDSENQQGLFDRIHAAKGGGNTALYDAIAAYLSRVQDGRGRRVMVLFSDGEDSVSELSEKQVLTLLRSSRVTAYAVAFSKGVGSWNAVRSRAFLDAVARSTGGRVFHPASSRDLPGIYQKLLDELANQYVLGYVPDRPATDSRFRSLSVRVRKRGLVVRHREGYVPRAATPR